MERSIQIKIIKDSKILTTYEGSFVISNTTTLKTLKELCRKRFSLSYPEEKIRESILLDGKEISDKRVIPQQGFLEYLLCWEAFTPPYKLGRQPILDERDLQYLLPKKIQAPSSKKQHLKLWESEGWWGDQGTTPECVGYAWAHWLDDQPKHKNLQHPLIPPTTIYLGAQKLDEWKGEQYEGTSVRGGVKYLRIKNKVSKYQWGFTLNSLIGAVFHLGPVVVGTPWYYHMFFPNKTGLIKVGGANLGGHAYLINGIDLNKKRFRIKNSWGKDWGLGGHAWIHFTDMARLIREGGEICYAS